MHGDLVSYRWQAVANGSPIKLSCSSRASTLVRTECTGESLKCWKRMLLELLTCFRTVKSSDSFPPASLLNYVSLGSGELSMFCVPQKNMSLAGLELSMGRMQSPLVTAVKFRVTVVQWEGTAICQERFKTPGGLVELWEVWEEGDGRRFGQGSWISHCIVSMTFKLSPSHLVPQPIWCCWRARTCSQVTLPQKGSYSCSFSSHVPLRCEVPYVSGSHLPCACIQPNHSLPHFASSAARLPVLEA